MTNYPEHLISTFQLPSLTITIRPVRPDDAELIQEFVRHLSSQTKHAHFMENFKELTKEMLAHLTQIDYDREMVLIATNNEVMIGMARYAITTDRDECESIVVVADEWQNKKIATYLMNTLIKVAQENGFKKMIGTILASNVDMLALAKNLGFIISNSDDPTVKIATKILS